MFSFLIQFCSLAAEDAVKLLKLCKEERKTSALVSLLSSALFCDQLENMILDEQGNPSQWRIDSHGWMKGGKDNYRTKSCWNSFRLAPRRSVNGGMSPKQKYARDEIEDCRGKSRQECWGLG
ncbi:hypothetical protein TURU_161562 [Turdus rufiventris]|nr:hypothetical protein TURU_161562 [Turdus rufiventris]